MVEALNLSLKTYSRKIKGVLREGEGQRLVEVSREVNKMRGKLKTEYFERGDSWGPEGHLGGTRGGH